MSGGMPYGLQSMLKVSRGAARTAAVARVPEIAPPEDDLWIIFGQLATVHGSPLFCQKHVKRMRVRKKGG
jgi:hypothetical protein